MFAISGSEANGRPYSVFFRLLLFQYYPHGRDQGLGPRPVEDSYRHSSMSSGISAAALDDRGTVKKTDARPKKFNDHYSQATLFWNSLQEFEKNHLVAAAWFELGKVTKKEIREKIVENMNKIDHELARRVAQCVSRTHADQTSYGQQAD